MNREDLHPHSQTAEEAVLGAVLVDPASLAQLNGVTSDDFYVAGHSLVWEAVEALAEAGAPVEISTVKNQMAQAGTLRRLQGEAEFLTRLAGLGATPSTVDHYAAEIQELSRRRRFMTHARQGIEAARKGEPPEVMAGHVLAAADLMTPATPSASSWLPVDLAGVLSGEREALRPGILHRADGQALLYPGKIHALYGEPESFKTWLALEACRQILDRDGTVVFIDFEDTEHGVVERLLALGVPEDRIADGFFYLRPGERISRGWPHLAALVEAEQPELVVVDGVTEAMTIEGLALEKNADIAAWYETLARPLARAGPAVWLLDHVVKAKDERGRFAIGGQAKLAGLDGASFRIDTVQPFGRGRVGISRLYVTKDRPGYVSALTAGAKRLVGEARAESNDDGTEVSVHIEAATEWSGPTVLMERVSLHLAFHPGGLSKAQVREGVAGRATYIDQALTQLIAEGYVRVETGPRGALIHYSQRPYPDPVPGEDADELPEPF